MTYNRNVLRVIIYHIFILVIKYSCSSSCGGGGEKGGGCGREGWRGG
jgi:hypothetical protein